MQVTEFAVMPPLDRLGATGEVTCYQCGRRILPGRKGPITHDENGVRHGRASGECATRARFNDGSDATIAMLAMSISR